MPPPTPSLRGLWVAAAAAGRLVEQMRTLEQAWAPLFDSTSDLPIFHEEDLTRPLFEPLGIDATLAGAVAHSLTEHSAYIEGQPHRPVRVYESSTPAPPRSVTPASRVESPRAFAPPDGVLTRPRPESDGPAPKELSPPRVMPEHRSAGDAPPISRAAASRHFDEMFERAGVRSAWRGQVVSTSSVERGVNAPAEETFAPVNAPASKPARALHGIRPDAEQSAPGGIFLPRKSVSAEGRADTRTRTATAAQTASQTISAGVASGDVSRGEDPLAHVLLPLIERLSRSNGTRPSRTGLATREHADGGRRGVETEEAEFMRPVPQTGLRRLAAGAQRERTQYKGENGKQGAAVNEQEFTRTPEPFGDFLAGTEGGEFGSQLAELLRRESLRLGIGIEEA